MKGHTGTQYMFVGNQVGTKHLKKGWEILHIGDTNDI